MCDMILSGYCSGSFSSRAVISWNCVSPSILLVMCFGTFVSVKFSPLLSVRLVGFAMRMWVGVKPIMSIVFLLWLMLM